MSRFYEWYPPYVSVAERRANAKAEMEKLRKKKGVNVQPVEISGRTIASSFWGKGWCDHIESFHDYANRLPRGRSYVRNGSVCHLEIKPGSIEALVSGSMLYNVAITIAPISQAKWNAVKAACAGQIGSLIDLLRGRLASGVMEVVSHRSTGLFPLHKEIRFSCDCPDSAKMCKHIAAVLYGVGARLDHAPEKLFHLRGVNHEEMVDVASTIGVATGAGSSRRRLAATSLDDIFGIDLAGGGSESADAAEAKDAPIPKAKKPVAARPATAKKEAKTEAQKATQMGAALPVKEVKVRAKVVVETPLVAPTTSTPFPRRLTGKVILTWRSSLRETQAEFASRIGVSAGCISQWEKKLRQTLQVRERALAALQKAWVDTH
uniref:Zinc finger SWIM domain protein n=1 Tax=Geobacter sp. (strain M21) TaxID=443144 RepID=C6DYZ8_GEOSM